MTNPCEIGLLCPHMVCSDEGDLICIHPHTIKDCPDSEDDTFGMIENVDCPLVDYPSVLYDLITTYHSFARGSSPSFDEQMSSAMRHTKGGKVE